MICRSGTSRACLSVRPAAGSTPIGARGREGERQVFDADHVVLAQQHGPLDDVLQLADVARPAVALQGGQRFVAEAVHLLARFLANLVEEMLGQQRNVGRSARAGSAARY